MPLDIRVTRLLARDSWESLRSLVHSRRPAIDSMANVSGVSHNDRRFDSRIIPTPVDGPTHALAEGQLVATAGWLHLIALEEDGDYHLQISAIRRSGDACVIAEVPAVEEGFGATALWPRLERVRRMVRKLIGRAPTRHELEIDILVAGAALIIDGHPAIQVGRFFIRIQSQDVVSFPGNTRC